MSEARGRKQKSPKESTQITMSKARGKKKGHLVEESNKKLST